MIKQLKEALPIFYIFIFHQFLFKYRIYLKEFGSESPIGINLDPYYFIIYLVNKFKKMKICNCCLVIVQLDFIEKKYVYIYTKQKSYKDGIRRILNGCH